MNNLQFNSIAQKLSKSNSQRRLKLEIALISSQLNWGDDHTRIQPGTMQIMHLNYALRSQALSIQQGANTSFFRDEFNKINL